MNRNNKPKGPAKLRAGRIVEVLDQFSQLPIKVWKAGYTGKKGWRYHPTKGFKRDCTFNPNQL